MLEVVTRRRPHSENSASDRLARALGTVQGVEIVEQTCASQPMTFEQRKIIRGGLRGRKRSEVLSEPAILATGDTRKHQVILIMG